jgi:hypothetical protein
MHILEHTSFFEEIDILIIITKVDKRHKLYSNLEGTWVRSGEGNAQMQYTTLYACWKRHQ